MNHDVNSPANKVTTEDYWDNVWSPYSGRAKKLKEANFYFGRDGIFGKIIGGYLGDISGKTILEFGGGGENFRLLAMAKWLGAHVTIVDYSDEGLKIARELFVANKCEVKLIKADICNWVPDEQYDIVVHWGVLEHFIDPAPILLKSAKALKSGGMLLFSMPNMEATASIFWRKWSPDNWSKHIFHSTGIINFRLREFGFLSIDSFYFGIPFFKITEWEVKSIWQIPLNLMQKLASALSRVLPVLPRMGHRMISMERCFVASKK